MNKAAALFIAILLAFVLAMTVVARAGTLHPESWYQNKWCQESGGEIEVLLEDRTECDCVLPDLAVEFGFAPKWANDMGQSLHYGRMLKRRPAMVMIIEDVGDWRHLHKVLGDLEYYNLPTAVWVMGTDWSYRVR